MWRGEKVVTAVRLGSEIACAGTSSSRIRDQRSRGVVAMNVMPVLSTPTRRRVGRDRSGRAGDLKFPSERYRRTLKEQGRSWQSGNRERCALGRLAGRFVAGVEDRDIRLALPRNKSKGSGGRNAMTLAGAVRGMVCRAAAAVTYKVMPHCPG